MGTISEGEWGAREALNSATRAVASSSAEKSKDSSLLVRLMARKCGKCGGGGEGVRGRLVGRCLRGGLPCGGDLGLWEAGGGGGGVGDLPALFENSLVTMVTTPVYFFN